MVTQVLVKNWVLSLFTMGGFHCLYYCFKENCKMKKTTFFIIIFVLILESFSLVSCVSFSTPAYEKETEYLEILNHCREYSENDEHFKITSNCGYYYEKTNDKINVYIIIPAKISTWGGDIINDVILVVNGKHYQYNMYLAGYFDSNDHIDQISRAVEIYLTKNYLKSYTPEQINNGLV